MDNVLIMTRTALGMGLLLLTLVHLIHISHRTINRLLRNDIKRPIHCPHYTIISASIAGYLLFPDNPYLVIVFALFTLFLIWIFRYSFPGLVVSRRLSTDKLSRAICKQQTDKVEEALKEGCDPNRQGYRGWTALHINSLKGGLFNDLLLQAGARADIKNDDGCTPDELLWIQFCAGQRRIPHYAMLKEFPAEVSLRDKIEDV